MLFHTNIFMLLTPLNLAAYQSQLATNLIPLQLILSWLSSGGSKPLGACQAAKHARPSSSKKEDSVFLFQLTVSRAIGVRRISEHVDSNLPFPMEKSLPCHHWQVSFISSCSYTSRDSREPMTLLPVRIFLKHFFSDLVIGCTYLLYMKILWKILENTRRLLKYVKNDP